MSPLDTLEKKLGRFALPGLIRYVVALNALVFLLIYIDPAYVNVLTLDPALVFQGQVWRVLTWIFIPTTTSIIWVIFYLMFTFWLGDLLEGTWGSFRLNVYYFLGYLGCTASAFLFGQSFANVALNATLLYAVGTLMPNLQVMLFLVIPVKVKWIAILSAVLFLITALSGDWATRGAIVITFINYLLFFGPVFLRQTSDSRRLAARRAKFHVASTPTESLHRCQTCSRTEVSNPELDFRVAADGHEYCTNHLPK